MANAHRHILQKFFGALLLLSTFACSNQPVIRSFSDLDQRLQAGNTVYITNQEGVRSKGKIKQLTANELLLDINGSLQKMEQHQILQIDRHANIILQGFGIGLGGGLLNAVFSDPPYEPCENEPQRTCAVEDTKERLILTGIFAVAGAITGALIRRRDDPVYLAPATDVQLSRPLISLAPVVDRYTSMPGISVSLRF